MHDMIINASTRRQMDDRRAGLARLAAPRVATPEV